MKATFDQQAKIWSGPKVPPIYNPDQNLGQLIVKVLEQTPDAVTQISADTGVSVTCGEMRDRILKIAAHLSGLGLKQGDVIGVVAANTENLAPLVFACFLLGLPVNPLAPIMIESDIIHMYSKTKPKVIFCDSAVLKVVQKSATEMKSEPEIYTIMDKVDGYGCVTNLLKTTEIKNFTRPEVDPNSTAFILCSSGSTGSPKGTCKSHKEIITHFVPTYEVNPTERNVLYQFSVLFWFSGIYYLVMGTLTKALRVITAEPSSSKNLIEIITKFKVTNIFTGPFAVVNLMQQQDLEPFESIRSWIIGGCAVSKAVCETFKRFVPNGLVNSSYGSSEYNFYTCDIRGERFGSCGTVIQNTDMKVADDDGSTLSNNEQGEFWARRAIPFLGYISEPEKTKEAYDGEWFKTGDIGYFDEDGFIYFVDRKKELLMYTMFRVMPSELEAIINSIDGVVSSCVVGVPEKNTGNDIIHAFVIVKESSKLTEMFIDEYVSAKVIDQKKLRGGVHFVDTFPLGFSGKVDKKELKKMAQEMM
jgi:4-coumarate--CoA ligase